MKILVYGAGPLGSLFAARLRDGGNDVSILARGQRLADLRAHGIVLEDGETGLRSVTQVNVVERLDPDDGYDLVLVIMRKNQAVAILPVLAASHNTPNILFMMNNGAGPAELVGALGSERVLIGFPTAAGARDGYVVRYLAGRPTHKRTIPIGEVDGTITERTRQVAAILGTMPGYDVAIRTDMDAWLRTHVAFLMPALAPALYAAGSDRERLARTRDLRVLAVRGMREAFQVLRAQGVPITPTSLRLFSLLPEPILVAYLGALLRRPEMEIGVAAHARAARDEVACHVDEFLELARRTTVWTPAIDRLYPFLNPTTPPLPDGRAEIPLNWRGIWLALAGLAGLGEGLALIFGRPAKLRRVEKRP